MHSPGALGAFRYQSAVISGHAAPATRYFPDILVALLYEHDGGGAGAGNYVDACILNSWKLIF